MSTCSADHWELEVATWGNLAGIQLRPRPIKDCRGLAGLPTYGWELGRDRIEVDRCAYCAHEGVVRCASCDAELCEECAYFHPEETFCSPDVELERGAVDACYRTPPTCEAHRLEPVSPWLYFSGYQIPERRRPGHLRTLPWELGDTPCAS